MPTHAVVGGLLERRAELAAHDRRGAELLVEAGPVDDPVALEQRPAVDELAVEAAEGRALVAGDEPGGAQAVATVGPHLVERHPHQRLDAGEEELAVTSGVLRLEVEHLDPAGRQHVGHRRPLLDEVGGDRRRGSPLASEGTPAPAPGGALPPATPPSLRART